MSTTKLRDHDIDWADYVFITAMLIQRSSAEQVLQRCVDRGVRTVVGGPLFTSLPEDFLQADHLVLKEAELTLPEFIADVRSGSPRKIYNTHEKADLASTPLPAWNLINPNRYASMCIQYSRGCPFDCDFCDVTTLFGHRIRTKSADQILTELQAIYDRGWRGNLFFVDDNFIGNKRKLKRVLLPVLAAWMRERNYPFNFNTQASINLADDEELMRMMVAAGFDSVFIGIETPSERALSECNKIQNTGRDLTECVARIQRAGMQVQAGFILGFDSDEPGVFDSLVHFIQDSGIVVAMVGLLNAPRGTKLYQRLAQEHRLTQAATGDNTDCSMNFLPRMGVGELVEGYQRVMQTIYSQRHYYERMTRFLRNYRVPPGRRPPLRRQEVEAFLKSIWHMGIVDPGRRYYWKLLLWSLRKRQYLHTAVTLSIYGYHFRKMTRALQPRLRDVAVVPDVCPVSGSTPRTETGADR